MGGSHMARIQRQQENPAQPLSQPANRFWPRTALVSSSAMYREEAGTKGEENDGGASGALGFQWELGGVVDGVLGVSWEPRSLPSVRPSPKVFFCCRWACERWGVRGERKAAQPLALLSRSHHYHSLISYLVTVSQASLGLSCHEEHAYARQRQTGRGRDRLKARLAPILRLLIPNALTSLRVILVIPHLPSPSSPAHVIHQITIPAAGPHRNQNSLEARYRPSPAPLFRVRLRPCCCGRCRCSSLLLSTASSPHSSTPPLLAHPPGFPPLFLSTTQSLNSPGSGSGLDIKPFWRLRPNRLPCQSPIPPLHLLYNLLDEDLSIPRASSFTPSLLEKALLHPVLDSDTTHSQCRRPQRTQRLPPPFPMARRTMCPFEATLVPRSRLPRPRCTLPTRP